MEINEYQKLAMRTINKDLSERDIEIFTDLLMSVIQWVDYLKYLNKSYPFLYDNAIRINPFKFN